MRRLRIIPCEMCMCVHVHVVHVHVCMCMCMCMCICNHKLGLAVPYSMGAAPPLPMRRSRCRIRPARNVCMFVHVRYSTHQQRQSPPLRQSHQRLQRPNCRPFLTLEHGAAFSAQLVQAERRLGGLDLFQEQPQADCLMRPRVQVRRDLYKGQQLCWHVCTGMFMFMCMCMCMCIWACKSRRTAS